MDGLYMRCACGRKINLLQAFDDNSATVPDPDDERRRMLASSTWLMTVVECECGGLVMFEFGKATYGESVTDPLGNKVRIPKREA